MRVEFEHGIVHRCRFRVTNRMPLEPPAHRFEMARAVVEFLKAAGQQAESLGVYETPAVIDRTAKIWKTLADEAR